MKPEAFSYLRPGSVAEVLEALAAHGDDAKILAGGQSLVPSMNMRLAHPAVVIDINGLEELSGVQSDADGGRTIGALVRHYELERIGQTDSSARLLRRAAREIGHLPIRIRGSMGGSLAHADPAAEWPVVVAALDGWMVLETRGGDRDLSSEEFFQGAYSTAIGETEILTRIRLPPLGHAVAGFAEVSRRPGDFATALAAVRIDLEGDAVAAARVMVGGMRGSPHRCREAEAFLTGLPVRSIEPAQVARVARSECGALSDVHGSETYRLGLAEVVVADALVDALGQLGEHAGADRWR